MNILDKKSDEELEKELVDKALAYATEKHEGQVRKYTGEAYINHPIAVCEIVKSAQGGYNRYMLAAALLHDVVEDTDTTIQDIRAEFGDIVAIFVDGLTDVSKPEDGNRAIRKEIDRQHLKDALPPIHTIKLADLINNSESIIRYGKGFAHVYIAEKKLLLDVLIYGDKGLYDKALDIVYKFEEDYS